MIDQKKLKKLRRSDLFELLVKQADKIEEQEDEIKKLEKKLATREIALSHAGSLAEASLALNKVFESAQAAADTYLYNLKRLTKIDNKDKG